MFHDDLGSSLIMALSKLISLTTSVVMLSACAPAVQQSADLNQEVGVSSLETGHSHKATKDNLRIATVKPGANVSMKSVLPKSMSSDAFQTVRMELTEGYQEGVMTVSIEPSEGLNLFGGSNSQTFNLSNPGPHTWDIDVMADVDGVYFLNVFALANGEPRSFSVRIDIGVTTQKMLDDVMPAQGELSEDGKIRVLGADETIQ